MAFCKFMVFLINTAGDWPLRLQGVYFARVPIPMRVGAGQPHKAEWWLKFDTLSHTELNRFLTSLNIVTLTNQSGLGKTTSFFVKLLVKIASP